MASSNRHWPSMFKSKPTACNTHLHHQWQSAANESNNNNLISPPPPAAASSASCHRSPYTSSGCEERSPEPKPRWNPKPEQIRILESIFNSGMVNPPREEIRKIRAQLQEYGQVGDANVFYWFQNRKSRSKHKTHRHPQKTQNHHSLVTAKVATTTTTTTTTTSSSSSSEKSYSKSIDFLLNSPTCSVNQHQHFGAGNVGGGGGGYHHHHNHQIEFSQEPFYFPTVQQQPPVTTSSFTEGFCFSEFGNVVSNNNNNNLDHHETVGSGTTTGMLLTDLMMLNQQTNLIQKMNHNNNNNNSKGVDKKLNVKINPSSCDIAPSLPHPTSIAPPIPTTTTTVSSTINDIQGVVERASGKSTVFINDVAFEVAVGPFNVREAFGDDAVLIHSYGLPVVTNEWGVTLQSLQHGAVYYLVRSFSNGQSSTIDLI